MKKFILKNLGMMLVAAVAFASCKKSESGGGNPPPSGKKLIKTEISAEEYSVFDYNGDGALTKVTDYEEGTISSIANFVYANKKVTEAAYGSGEKLRFTYSGDNIDTMKIYSNTGVYAGFVKYTYNGNKINQQSFFYGEEGNFMEMQRLKFTYSPSGNVATQTMEVLDIESSQWIVYGKTAYTRYDNKINPLSLSSLAILGKIAGVVQKNNVEEEKYYQADNTLSETRTYTYTYDNDGYPTAVTEKVVAEDGEFTQTTKFIYK